ncbi:hypothetical protein TRAPUB_12635 [Trametes pubescens]|uniref:C2H2-type domain-containing protein n=1 Tax=Trametes pubescens TaxID=154538 RepID=A0A1M2VTC2_TRAPU|nr:hypothetical protein TRAPUB_12635 [Trametes pubescens]
MTPGERRSSQFNALRMQVTQCSASSSTKKKQAACSRDSSFEPESEDEPELEPVQDVPSSPEIPLKQIRDRKLHNEFAVDTLKKTLVTLTAQEELALSPTYRQKMNIDALSETTSKPGAQPQPQLEFDTSTGPVTQMHMQKPPPKSKSKPAAKAAPAPPPKKKAASSRRAHEAPWAKTAPLKKRGTRPTPKPIGSRTCFWDGCSKNIVDARTIWDHITKEHNGGRPVKVGVKVKEHKGQGGAGRGAGREEEELPLKREIDEDYDAPELEEGQILEGDREDDSLEDGEFAIAVEEEKAEVEEKAKVEEESDEEVVVEVKKAKSKVKSRSKTDQWFDKVECLWGGCNREIQFIGLQRHVETRHIPIRGAFCTKGCGKHVARYDMLWRHVARCNHESFEEKKEEEWEEEWEEIA